MHGKVFTITFIIEYMYEDICTYALVSDRFNPYVNKTKQKKESVFKYDGY